MSVVDSLPGFNVSCNNAGDNLQEQFLQNEVQIKILSSSSVLLKRKQSQSVAPSSSTLRLRRWHQH